MPGLVRYDLSSSYFEGESCPPGQALPQCPACGSVVIGLGDVKEEGIGYSTVTDLAKLRGLSTSVPRASAVW
ncbi:MAG: hypothetical protein RL748_535 [Pseudomonadota bacterium]